MSFAGLDVEQLRAADHADHVHGVYVHVPFCASDCAYCAFSREVPPDRHAVSAYLDALSAEIDVWRERFGGPLRPQTLYVGGGTPTFLTPDEIARLVSMLARLVRPDRLVEVTVESNPESTTPERLTAYAALGLTRVSIGAQSHTARLLAVLDRTHDWTAVARAVDAARSIASAPAVSLDLIYAIPGQTLDEWRASLEAALRLAPAHLSAYCLGYEEGTALGRRRGRGELTGLPDDVQRAMYDVLVASASAAGLPRYEVSNFGTEITRSRHNLGYWRREEMLGIGPSAHSFLAGRRFWNHPTRVRWQEALSGRREPVAGYEVLDDAAVVGEELMRLRMVEGASRERFAGAPPAFWREVDRLVEAGLLEPDPDRLRLSTDAFFVSDGLVAELWAAWDGAGATGSAPSPVASRALGEDAR